MKSLVEPVASSLYGFIIFCLPYVTFNGDLMLQTDFNKQEVSIDSLTAVIIAENVILTFKSNDG